MEASTIESLRTAQERLKDAEKQVVDAKKEANSAKEQVRDAETYLKGVESKWEVIDVDEDEADNNNVGDNNNRLKEGKKEYDHAINYVLTIKKNHPEIYHKFLEILNTYQKEQQRGITRIDGIKEVLDEMSLLFADRADLLKEFIYFLPDAVQSQAKAHLDVAAKKAEDRARARELEAKRQQEEKLADQNASSRASDEGIAGERGDQRSSNMRTNNMLNGENEFGIRRSRVVNNNNSSASRNRRGRSIGGGMNFSSPSSSIISERRRIRSRSMGARDKSYVPTNPIAKDLLNSWRDRFGCADDDNEESSGRGRKDKQNFRGTNISSSYAHPSDTRGQDRMLARGREQRGYSKRQEPGGRVFNSQVEDPLDQAASLQAANRVPRLKQAYTKSLGSNMSKLIRMNGSSQRNRRKNKRDEKREQCARAATRRSDSIDSSSSEGGRKSSGKKRKAQYDDR